MSLLLKRTLFAPIVLVALPIYAGTWTALTHLSPDSINLMLLLPDGTVMAQGAEETNWYRLTPDIHGSYVNGTWSTLAGMHYVRIYFSSDVLTNGQVFVAGGEDGNGSATAEVYDPIANTWTVAPAQPNTFLDSCSEVLPSGNVLVAPVSPANYGETLIWNTASNNWSIGPTLYRGDDQDEASWVKLPDGSILTIDPYTQNSERYIPALNQWIDDADVGIQMYSSGMELGAGFLLPNGEAFYLGGSGNTAIYTPTGTTNAGSWTAGPPIPNGLGIEDGPAAMMINGKILCAVGSSTNYSGPTYFYEYDPVANSFSQVNGPAGTTDYTAPFENIMLDLPDGSVLYSHEGPDLYIYRTTGSPLAVGQPTITGITANNDSSFTLTGTLLNGISEGAAYGDDAQMASNYPLIRLTNSAGNVYYERTYNWSSTGVKTGSTPETTQFTNSAGVPWGTYSLTVAANGISSAPYSFVFQPKLALIHSGGNVILSWPTNSAGFILKYTTNPSPATVWSANSQPITVINGQNVVTNKLAETEMFFRLQ
jgi:Kelch motif